MNIYDTANKLAKEIKESKEYKEYRRLKKHIEENPEQKEKVENFEHLRYKIQVETMQGNNANTEEEKIMLQEKYAELLKDEEIKKYFDAEMQFNVMIADINKIIAEAIKDVL